MPTRRLTAVTLTAAAGVATVGAAGAAARRATRKRSLLDGLERGETGSDRPFEWYAGAHASVTTSDGVRLHVEIDEPEGWDSGPTVVFSHGYCLTLGSWIHQRRAIFDAGYRCVAWDQRGHGQSSAGTAADYTVDRLGRDLADVVTTVAPDGPLVLVGHSMGAMTVMALGAEDAQFVHERVIAVAFVATSPGGGGLLAGSFGRTLGTAMLRFGPAVLARIAARQRLWSAVRRVGRDVESLLVAQFSFASPVSQEAVRYVADMLMGTDPNVVGAFLPGLETHDKVEALQAFAGCESLVVNGEDDLLTPPEHSATIVDALPGAEHVLINDAGHLVMLEHPALVNAQLLALIERATTASAPPATRRRVERAVTDIARRRHVAALRPPRRRRSRSKESV